MTSEHQNLIEDLARRHEVSVAVVEHLVTALTAGSGRQAQFNHAELGGMGQWSSGGMVMIGDMFNNGLKQRVDMLCSDIAASIQSGALSRPNADRSFQSQSQGSGSGVSYRIGASGASWPQDLGQPSSTGAQNNLRYAFFPASRRLAIDVNGRITVYGTKDHDIGGFSQQQGGDQSLTFTSQHGLVRVQDLDVVSADDPAPPLKNQRSSASGGSPQPAVAPSPATAPNVVPSPAGGNADDIFGKIERLADLHGRGILSDEEFAAKKTELLQRL